MKKEVVFAIIIGFGIGLVITFGIYQAQRTYINQTVTSIESTALVEPTPQITQEHTLDVTVPENFSLTDQSTITITGFTSPLSFVTIVTESDEVITKSNQAGSFSTEFDLEENANVLTITAIDPQGNQVEETVTVTYLEPPVENTPTLAPDEEEDNE